MFHIAALKPDGRVLAAGKNLYGECDVSGWQGIIAISAGPSYTLGLRYDGTVVSTGLAADAADALKEWKNIIAISAGSDVIAGLKADGSVVVHGSCGENSWKKWHGITAISAGQNHVVGLTEEGTMVWSGYGEEDIKNRSLLRDAKDVTRICAGSMFTVYRSGGELFARPYAYGKGSGFQVIHNYTDNYFRSGWQEKWAPAHMIFLGWGNLLGIGPEGHVIVSGTERDGKMEGIESWRDMVELDAGLDFIVGVNGSGKLFLTGSKVLDAPCHPLQAVLGWELFDDYDAYAEYRNARLQEERDRTIQALHQCEEALSMEKNSIFARRRYRQLEQEQKTLQDHLLLIRRLER